MKSRIFLLPLLLLLIAAPASLAGANQAGFAPETPDSTAAGANKPVFAPGTPKEAPLAIKPCEAFHARQLIAPGVLLAGGITPDNVREAIEQVNPAGIDVSSGVESAPGIKDSQLIQTLVERIHI